jgi:hypothetical protein
MEVFEPILSVNELAVIAALVSHNVSKTQQRGQKRHQTEGLLADKRGTAAASKRSSRKKYKHDETLATIQRDFLGDAPLILGSDFKSMFRISRTRFQCIMEKILMAADIDFYKVKATIIGDAVEQNWQKV